MVVCNLAQKKEKKKTVDRMSAKRLFQNLMKIEKSKKKKKKAKENWPNPVVSNLCRLFPNSTHNFTISDLAECFTNLNKVYNFKGNSTHVLYTVSLNYFGRKCCYSSPLEGTLPM